MPLAHSVLKEVCPLNLIQDCIPGKYRTYSGHCNNVMNPLWGAKYEPMQRLQFPDYSDGKDPTKTPEKGYRPLGKIKTLFFWIRLKSSLILTHWLCLCSHPKKPYLLGISHPRVSSTGHPLPSPRVLSKKLFTVAQKQHNVCSMMLATWAQFIYEDIAKVGSNRLYNQGDNFALPCCADPSHPECLPIPTEGDDEVFKSRGWFGVVKRMV